MDKKKRKLVLKIVIPIVLVLVVGIIVAVVVYKNSDSDSSEDYYYFLQDGYYEKAYEKAENDEEKQEIIKQNAVEYVCSLVFTKNTQLKSVMDDTKLANAWYDDDKNIVILFADRTNESDKIYLYYSFSQESQDYDFVCASKDPITIDNISLADTYTNKIKNSDYKDFASYALYTLKSKLPEKLENIMAEKNKLEKRNIANIQRKITLDLLNDSTLLDV